MSTQTIIILIAVAAVIVIGIARTRSGPRVTTITREREVKHEDRDDA